MTYAIRVGRLVLSQLRHRVTGAPVEKSVYPPARTGSRGSCLHTLTLLTLTYIQGMMVHGNGHFLLNFCGIASGVLICAGLMYVLLFVDVQQTG